MASAQAQLEEKKKSHSYWLVKAVAGRSRPHKANRGRGLAQETAGVFTGSAADLLHFTWRKWKCAATAALCFTRHFPAIGGTPPPSDGLGQQSRRIGF